MRKVLIFGTFDGLHEGHLSFINQSRRHGDFVTAVVTRDSNVSRQKGYSPVNKEIKRLGEVKRHVDEAILGEKTVTYGLIKKIRPDIICIGYDQSPSMRETKGILKRIGVDAKVLRMRPFMPKKYKSSILNKSR